MSFLDSLVETASDTADYVEAEWFEPIVKAGSSAFNFLTTTETGGDLLKGASVAGLEYLAQREKQKHDEKMLRLEEDRADNRHFVGGGVDLSNHGTLTNGILTNVGSRGR